MTYAFLIDSVQFSKATVAGETSLGGSESACVGLARALAARGHDVHIYATRLDADAAGPDAGGVTWHPANEFRQTNSWIEWDVVVALRQCAWFGEPVMARLRLLWNQDLLMPGVGSSIMSVAWQIDRLVYVSDYHQRQWEDEQPELKGIGWATKNGFDASLVPTDAVKHPNRIIHISRPERGLEPILAMWPALKAQRPDAELHICRYQSMYDSEGSNVKAACEHFDREVARVNQAVGGITWLGSLGKRDLYRAIAESAVMWYPGIDGFAETSCWTPDTPVAVPGGHTPISQVKAGDLVMSYDEQSKRIVAKRVKWCKQTGANRAVLKLTYKWKSGRRAGRQESIVGTPDHKMLRRDGTWTTLGELRAGDSLMPMFRKSDGKYWEVGHDGTRYKYEHDLVGEAKIGRPLAKGEIAHHINGDGLNNHESNLAVWQQSAHIRHHLPEMKARYADLHPFDYERAQALKRQGLPQHQIAAMLGTTQATVSRKLAASNHVVVSIEPAGFSDVWDMEVEDTHTFIAGHVVVHNCIAAIESQANGTPFVGSWKGALPETVPSGVLVPGDAMTPAYQERSIAAVLAALDGCASQGFAYRKQQLAGRAHVKGYTYDAIATEWDAQVQAWFAERYEAHKPAILEQLLQEDDHCAAKLVAADIITECEQATVGVYRGHFVDDTPEQRAARIARVQKTVDDQRAEAVRAALFCDRVIAGLEQGADDYAAHAIQDPLAELDLSGRFKAVIPRFAACASVLDAACGNGAFAIGLALAHPTIHVHGLDYAQGNIDLARKTAERVGVADRVTFERRTIYDFDAQAMHHDWAEFAAAHAREFDGLFVGEFVEHVADTPMLVDALEATLADGALVVYTCPHGPFGELVRRGQPIQRGHVHCFKHDDIKAVWGAKREARADFFEIGLTPRGNPIGHWIVHYRCEAGRAAGARDLRTRALRTRPKPRLSVGLITKNAALDLARCLTSVWHIADEIVVGDTGSTDETIQIAETFGAQVLELDPIEAQPEGFAGARNQVLRACTGDWFLWIDADEQLTEPYRLRWYLESALFQGYVIHQKHLFQDQAPTYDIPVRLFRRRPDIQFYGCVHEQPQMGDCNGDIHPSLEPGDIELLHTGYLTQRIREHKRTERNLPLIVQDQQVFPKRELGKVILLREMVLQTDARRAAYGGRLVPPVVQGYQQAIDLFVAHFDDPGHKFAPLARPWYEGALRGLGMGFEMELALAGKPTAAGGLKQAQARADRVVVRDAAEFQRLVAFQASRIGEQMTPTRWVKTNPDLRPYAPPADPVRQPEVEAVPV